MALVLHRIAKQEKDQQWKEGKDSCTDMDVNDHQ